MNSVKVNRVSLMVLIALSLTALMAVVSGYFQPPQPDEGPAAHIFQIAVVLIVPMMLLFLATADWRRPWRSVRNLGFFVAPLAVAFAALYRLEHFR